MQLSHLSQTNYLAKNNSCKLDQHGFPDFSLTFSFSLTFLNSLTFPGFQVRVVTLCIHETRQILAFKRDLEII